MTNVTEAIILSSIKYSETSVIMKCYSEEYGILSFIIKGIRSKKRTKFSLSSIEALSIVEIEFSKGLILLSSIGSETINFKTSSISSSYSILLIQ